ncbi:hypothetical protein [Motilibacter rhizosphaerae]|uniref:hypothetical protein n=1 Tax=Motilibacter rhizosphaerae TaxID=598652 RepID=UPI00102C42C7|nr:hypothetical protein [Motilibacter rhizosphaerae]
MVSTPALAAVLPTVLVVMGAPAPVTVTAADLPGTGWSGARPVHGLDARALSACTGAGGALQGARLESGGTWTRGERGPLVSSTATVLPDGRAGALATAYARRLPACARTVLVPEYAALAPFDTAGATVRPLVVHVPRGARAAGVAVELPVAGTTARFTGTVVLVTAGRRATLVEVDGGVALRPAELGALVAGVARRALAG